MELVHCIHEICFQVRDAASRSLLFLLELLPVGNHVPELFVGGVSQAGHSVRTLRAPVRKAGEHRAQALHVRAALRQGPQVGVVVLPIGDLALQRRIDAARAGCYHRRRLIP